MIDYDALKSFVPEFGLGPWLAGSHSTPDYAPQYGIHAESGGNDFLTVRGSRELAAAAEAIPEMAHALLQMHKYFIGDIPLDRAAVYEALRKANIDFHGV